MSSISQTPYIIGRWHNIGKWIPRSISLILLAIIAYMTLVPSSVFGYAGLGGYLSEKLMGSVFPLIFLIGVIICILAGIVAERMQSV